MLDGALGDRRVRVPGMTDVEKVLDDSERETWAKALVGAERGGFMNDMERESGYYRLSKIEPHLAEVVARAYESGRKQAEREFWHAGRCSQTCEDHPETCEFSYASGHFRLLGRRDA